MGHGLKQKKNRAKVELIRWLFERHFAFNDSLSRVDDLEFR